MEDITLKEASEQLQVSRVTLLKWIEKGILKEGVKRGKAKTVTIKSVNEKLNDESFMSGLRISQKNRRSAPKDSQKNREELKAKIDELEKKVSSVDVLEKTIRNIEKRLKILEGIIDRIGQIPIPEPEYISHVKTFEKKEKTAQQVHKKIAGKKTEGFKRSNDEVLRASEILTAIEKQNYGSLRELLKQGKEQWKKKGKYYFHVRLGVDETVLNRFIKGTRDTLGKKTLNKIKNALS